MGTEGQGISGGCSERSDSSEAGLSSPSQFCARAFEYLRARMAPVVAWVRAFGTRSRDRTDLPESVSRTRRDEGSSSTLRRGPVASLVEGGENARDRDTTPPQLTAADALALPERPGLVADETDDHLRLGDPENDGAYLESDRWVRVRR